MKTIFLLQALLFSCAVFAQTDKHSVHGVVFGKKPDQTAVVSAEKLDGFMAQKPRITITLKGTVVNVVKEKGGWFTLNAGKGKVITAHFKDYNVNIPSDLKGKMVITEGVAQRQLVAADQQHYAGKKEPDAKADPKQISFEAIGLIIE